MAKNKKVIKKQKKLYRYLLIRECRVSGMTDYQWYIAHNIKPGLFYNWIKRL